MTLNILNNISTYTVQWFTKDLGLDKNPLLLFKANEFKFYKKDLKGKPTLGWLPVACQASSMNWLPFWQA